MQTRGKGAGCCDEHVCGSVCLSVPDHVSRIRYPPDFRLCVLTVAVLQCSFDGVTIVIVISVLWITSTFPIKRPMAHVMQEASKLKVT